MQSKGNKTMSTNPVSNLKKGFGQPLPVAADMAAKVAALEATTSAEDARMMREVEEIKNGPTLPPPPVFKQWKIQKLEDLFSVDKDQSEKVFYFAQHMIRKARLENKKLIYFIFSEQGGGHVAEVKFKDMKLDEDDVDPLS